MSGFWNKIYSALPHRLIWLDKSDVLSAAKYPLPPKRADFCKQNFFRSPDLCYVNPEFHKLKIK